MPSGAEDVIEQLDALDRRCDFDGAKELLRGLDDFELAELKGRGNGFTRLKILVERLERENAARGDGCDYGRPTLTLIHGGLSDA